MIIIVTHLYLFMPLHIKSLARKWMYIRSSRYLTGVFWSRWPALCLVRSKVRFRVIDDGGKHRRLIIGVSLTRVSCLRWRRRSPATTRIWTPGSPGFAPGTPSCRRDTRRSRETSGPSRPRNSLRPSTTMATAIRPSKTPLKTSSAAEVNRATRINNNRDRRRGCPRTETGRETGFRCIRDWVNGTDLRRIPRTGFCPIPRGKKSQISEGGKMTKMFLRNTILFPDEDNNKIIIAEAEVEKC